MNKLTEAMRAGADRVSHLLQSRALVAALAATPAAACGLFDDTHVDHPEDTRNGLRVQNGVDVNSLRVYAQGANPYTPSRDTQNCYYVAQEITPINAYDNGGIPVPNADQLTHVAHGYALDLENSPSGAYNPTSNPNGCPETPPVMDQVATGMVPLNNEPAELGRFFGKVFDGDSFSLNRGVTYFEEMCIQVPGSGFCNADEIPGGTDTEGSGSDSDSGTGDTPECQTDLECYNRCEGACVEGKCQLVPPVLLIAAEDGPNGVKNKPGIAPGAILKLGTEVGKSEPYDPVNGINIGLRTGYETINEQGIKEIHFTPAEIATESVMTRVELEEDGVTLCEPRAKDNNNDGVFEQNPNFTEYMKCHADNLAQVTEVVIGEATIENECFYSNGGLTFKLNGYPEDVY